MTPVYDLYAKDEDLVVATHGRGFWILDDLSALRECAKDLTGLRRPVRSGVRLFAPGKTHRILPDLFAGFDEGEGRSYSVGLITSAINIASKSETGQVQRKFLDAGAGRDRGAIVYYELPEGLPADTNYVLEFLDSRGKVIRGFKPKPADYDSWDDKKKSLDTGPWITVKAGVNRFVWNMRHAGAERVAGNKTALAANEGPVVSPGQYKVRLIAGETTLTQSFEVINDPRVTTPLKDLQAQEKQLLRMRDAVGDAHRAVNRLRDLREQLQLWKKRAVNHKDIADACDAVLKKLDKIEDELILPGEQKDSYGLISRERLNAAVASLMSVVWSADAKPTKSSQALFSEQAVAIEAEVNKLNAVIRTDVAALNRMIAKAKLPAVGV